MTIRQETEKDYGAARAVHIDAFEGPGEAKLVDMLRAKASPIVSLVAENEGFVIGHIMFFPVKIEEYDIKIKCLAPFTKGAFRDVSGTIKYHSVFAAL